MSFFLIFFLVKMAQEMKKHYGALAILDWLASLPITEEKLTVSFLAKTPNKVLAEAETSFKVLKIPRYHIKFDNFVKYMDLSISHSKVEFGKI